MARILSLCKSRAGERSRIWLEGKWLAEAGFPHGTRFHVEARPVFGGFVLTAYLVESYGVRKGRVSGSPSRPVIDITGQHVLATFAGFERVAVSCGIEQGRPVLFITGTTAERG